MHEHAFIIRCWDEAFEPQFTAGALSAPSEASEDHPRPQRSWRYSVVHVGTGLEATFDTLNDITVFIAEALSNAV